MATQDVIVINEGFEERRRTTSKGTKSRFTFSVKAEPILHNFDNLALGAGPAQAIRDAITEGIKAISVVASAATLLRRKYAKAAMAKGTPSTIKRYSGGKTGTTEPGQSDRLFNDSGRLANGIFVRQNPQEHNWTVNVPANRLDPSTFRDASAFQGMVARLRELVPAIANPFSSPKVVEAIQAGLNGVLIRKLAATTKTEAQLGTEILRTIGEMLRMLSELDSAISGI